MMRVRLCKGTIGVVGFNCRSSRGIPVLRCDDISEDTVFYDHSFDLDLKSHALGISFVFGTFILFLKSMLRICGYVRFVNVLSDADLSIFRVLNNLAELSFRSVMCGPGNVGLGVSMKIQGNIFFEFPSCSGAIVDYAIREFLYSSSWHEYESARTSITSLYVKNSCWSPIIRDVCTNRAIFPALRDISYDASSMDALCDAPVSCFYLAIKGANSDCCARIHQVVRDSKIHSLTITSIADTFVLESESIRVFEQMGGKGRFHHKFPRLSYALFTGDFAGDFDFSGCPKMHRVAANFMTESVFVRLLSEVESLTLVPEILAISAQIPFREKRSLVSDHAPHLLPTLNKHYFWTPRFHPNFRYKRQRLDALFGTFLCGCDFLASTSAIPTFDPAVLELVLRHEEGRFH